MKRTRLYLMLAAAVALVSCNKEIEKPLANETSGIQVTLNAEFGTKTYVEGVTPYWHATDALGVFDGTTETNAKFDNTKADGELGVFNGAVPSAGTYYAYYPYSTGGANDSGALVLFPDPQEPTPTSFDPKADLLLSEAFDVTTTDPTDQTLRFTRLGAFLKINFIDATTGSVLADEYATLVSVIVDNGELRPAPSVRITPSGLGTRGSGMKTIKASYAADTFKPTEVGNATYLGILPQTLAEGSSLDITVNTTSYTLHKKITLASAIEINGGDVQPINMTISDADLPVKVVKLWEKLSTDTVNWMKSVDAGATAGSDFNIAIDDKYVYVPEFGGTKTLWAIDIATGSVVKSVDNSTIESVGFDSSIYLSCARVVKKSDGTPVLLASNLFQDASTKTGRLYIWDNGIDEAARVVTLNQWNAGRRLGDTFTTYGNYEDCWLLMSTQTGNGFVTFKVPTTGDEATLISRLATDTGDFCSYYPFPGDITKGMFTWRGGTHDDGIAYRNRYMTVASTESAIKDSGAHTATLTKLSTWMANYENNNGSGFNFIEFGGRRFVIWVINMADSKTFDLVIKSGSTDTDWKTIIDTPISTITAAGGFAQRFSHVGGMDTTWKQGTDCAVWNNGDEVYIAVNKINVGLAVYKMSL